MPTRCNAAERAAFNAKRIRAGYGDVILRGQEPALGTLDERLGIIVRRLGGQTAWKHHTAAELAAYRTTI